MIRTGLSLFDFNSRGADLQLMGEGREPGLHQSQLIQQMKADAGENVKPIEGEQEWFRAQIGFLWENALEYAFKEYMGVEREVDHQLRMQTDGIWQTPDGHNLKEDILEEYKLTWRSARKWVDDNESFWPWHVQTKGYLWGLGQKLGRPILSVDFFICFINGDYSWKSGGVYKRLANGIYTERFTYESWELEENWDVILRYKDMMEREVNQ